MTTDGANELNATGRPTGQPPVVDVSTVPLAQVRTAADFARCLERVRVLAGPLSRREIEQRSERRLRRTKIGQVLDGELPRRDFLAVYLEVCGVAESARAEWFLVWSRLVTPTAPPARDLRPVLPRQDESIRTELRLLRAERDEATSRARAALAENDQLSTRLATAERRHQAAAGRLAVVERAHQDAADRVRALTRELHAAQGRIADLQRTVHRLRAAGEEAERESVLAEIAGLRDQLDHATPAPGGSKRLTRYTRAEANDLYGSTAEAPPAVIGEEDR